MSPADSNNQRLTWKKNAISLTVVTLVFLLWGLVTVLNGVMTQDLVNSAKVPVEFRDPHGIENDIEERKRIIERGDKEEIAALGPSLQERQANMISFRRSLLSFVFFGVYLVFAYPAGRIIKLIGYKKGIISGLAILATGCIAIIGTALLGNFTAIVIAVSFLGVGITMLQVAANPYVLFVSDPETAASRLTFVQAFNSLGTFIAPAIVAFFAFNSIGGMLGCQDIMEQSEVMRQSNAHEIIFPYLFLGGLLVLGALLVNISNLPEASAVHLEGEPNEDNKKSAWQYPHLIFAALAIFAYVGAEVAISANLVNYYQEVNEVTGEVLPFSTQYLVYIYFGGAILGRLIGSYLLKVNETHNLVVLFAVLAAMLVFVAFSGHNLIAVYCLTSVGIFNSILFPSIFALGIRGLGKHSEEGSSILIMAISGGALVPFLFTMYHDRMEKIHELGSDAYHHTNYDGALWVPFVCYMAIVFYGLFGYRFRREDSVHFEKDGKDLRED